MLYLFKVPKQTKRFLKTPTWSKDASFAITESFYLSMGFCAKLSTYTPCYQQKRSQTMITLAHLSLPSPASKFSLLANKATKQCLLVVALQVGPALARPSHTCCRANRHQIEEPRTSFPSLPSCTSALAQLCHACCISRNLFHVRYHSKQLHKTVWKYQHPLQYRHFSQDILPSLPPICFSTSKNIHPASNFCWAGLHDQAGNPPHHSLPHKA